MLTMLYTVARLELWTLSYATPLRFAGVLNLIQEVLLLLLHCLLACLISTNVFYGFCNSPQLWSRSVRSTGVQREKPQPCKLGIFTWHKAVKQRLCVSEKTVLCVAASRALMSVTNTIANPDKENQGRSRRCKGVVSYKEPSLHRWVSVHREVHWR